MCALGRLGAVRLPAAGRLRRRARTDRAFEELLTTTKHPRAVGTLALVNARYIIETEEWKVQPVADGASAETILANGMSAVKTGDLATAEKMAAMLTAKAGGPPAAGSGGAHADHGGGASARRRRRESRRREGRSRDGDGAGRADRRSQGPERIRRSRCCSEAVKIEESMRPPNGAADPVKPSHELLGEVLLRSGKAKEAAAAFDASLLLMPNRARALMGAAQAHAAAGNAEAAAARHQTLMSFWKGKAPAPPTATAAPAR